MMRPILCFALALAAYAFSAPVLAEEEYQHQIDYFQQTIDGKTAVCGVEETVVFKDQTYVKTTGGLHLFISFFGNDKKFLAGFKFSEGSFLNGPAGPIVQEPIGNASVYFDGRSLPLIRSPCQNDTMSFCGGIGGDDAGYFATAISLSGAKLRFNRGPGQIDYDFDISLRPTPSMDSQQAMSFVKSSPVHNQCLFDIWSMK